jgi:hypothetical protein
MTEQHTTGFGTLRGTGTSMQRLSPPSGTMRGPVPTVPRFNAEPSGLVEWLGTRQARQYEGQWVLLRDDFGVIDHAHSPTDLLRRHPDPRTPMVVFVDPAGINLAV